LTSRFSRSGEATAFAKRRFGQHFLSDVNILNRIAAAAELSLGQTVVEVGPGRGALTDTLARRGATVVAVEVDADLIGPLRERFAGEPRVRIVQGDVLEISPSCLLAAGDVGPPYIVVANLPYNIAAAVLRHFLEGDVAPRRMVVMVQREVAEAIVASTGRMSMLSVATHVYGEARLVMRVAPGSFTPPPAVQSAVVRIDVAPTPRVDAPIEPFFRIARAGFGNPRKKLRNSLSFGLHVKQEVVDGVGQRAGIDMGRRAQTLSLDEWAALTRAWEEMVRA
jgi:16S rRNA (adenine1518-N6/adenine1519-N6)-dimethyltransferase